MKSSFLIVTDRGNLKAYRVEKAAAERPPRLHLVQSIALAEAHAKTGEVNTDSAGRFMGSTSDRHYSSKTTAGARSTWRNRSRTSCASTSPTTGRSRPRRRSTNPSRPPRSRPAQASRAERPARPREAEPRRFAGAFHGRAGRVAGGGARHADPRRLPGSGAIGSPGCRHGLWAVSAFSRGRGEQTQGAASVPAPTLLSRSDTSPGRSSLRSADEHDGLACGFAV